MAVEFRLVAPDRIRHIPRKSLGYLKSASLAVTNYLEVDIALDQARHGQGCIYETLLDSRLTGCFFFNYVTNHLGRTMNLILLGGERLPLWAADLSRFLNTLCHENEIDQFTMLGRKGFEKLFPELEPIACVYRKKFEN